MCDTLVALPATTQNHSMLFAKSADCEVNEANVLVRIPHKTVRCEFPKPALAAYGFKMP